MQRSFFTTLFVGAVVLGISMPHGKSDATSEAPLLPPNPQVVLTENTVLLPIAAEVTTPTAEPTSTAKTLLNKVAIAMPEPAEAVTPAPASSGAPGQPARLVIPSINLNDAVIRVGLTSDGAMDVPSGKTKNVGWYDGGTLPGNIGSAVMDAHVFAAFSSLKNVAIGSDIYVLDENGNSLHFKVNDARVYALADVPAETLFNRSDAAHLNLITCAGKLTADHSTYDHRLVVYATLVS